MITEHILEHQRKHHCKWGKSDYKELLHKNHQSITSSQPTACYLIRFGSVSFGITTATTSRHQHKQLSLSPTKIKKIKKEKFKKSSQEPEFLEILCDIRVF